VWSSTTINADSPELANGDLPLHGYFHMLRAGITSNQANFKNAESPYLADATNVSTGNQVYSFDKETLLLQLGSTNVTLANGVTITQGPGMFGLNCGPLFPTALSSLGDVSSQTTTYEWSIGTNPWNQLRTLKDAQGAFVQFDAPIRMNYVHDEVGTAFHNRTFFLEWDGANLNGVPYEQNGDTGMWYPQFNIPSSTVVTSGASSYKIKQLEGEQFMIEVGSPSTVYAAQGFDLDGTPITAPVATPYQDPATGALTNQWIEMHESGHVAGFVPLLVMDVWEHAFILDYAAKDRPKYIEAFFSNVDWRAVESRLARKQQAAAA
jgi:hypothetical protein